MSIRHRWYLSAAAVREYLAIAGLHDDDGGPIWDRAEQELGQHAEAARLVEGSPGGRQLYRTGRVQCGDRPRKTRLEMTVKPPDTTDAGPLDALVRVREKGTGTRR